MKANQISLHLTAWIRGQKTTRVILAVGVAVLALLVLGTLSFMLHQDIQAFGRFPEGVSVCGIGLGGLTKEEALSKCRTDLAEIADRPLALHIDDEVYQATPQEISLTVDYQAMVDEAYEIAWSLNIVERMLRRFLDKPKHVEVPLVVHYDDNELAAFVTEAMEGINRSPHDAYIDVSSGVAEVVPAKDGRTADFEQLMAQAREALKAPERAVDVGVARTPAAMTDEGFGKFILVNLGSHTLSLYNREEIVSSYPIACGSEEWPTCSGQWKVVKAEKNPTWYNRGSEWAKEMPDSIPPGPGNPLGTRAITINGGGVLIHGTTDTWSIGRSASHGCIRMYMGDVEELFNHVTIGMPVYIIRKSGEPGFDCSKKPFWWDE